MPSLDLARVRAAFPALAGDTVFLDNAGGSQVLATVADRVRDYLLTTSVQLGASYACSIRAAERVVAARRSMAELVNAPYDEEVVIGPSTTALLATLARGVAASIRPGDEIVVTDVDHESNVGPWVRLAERGAVVKVWDVDPDSLRLELDGLERVLTERTRWVALTHASNVVGTVHPVAEIARRVHAAGARLCVDAVAYAPHRLVDVQATGADAVVFSTYKVFGPHQAVLWAPRELLRSLPGQNHFFIGDDDLPYKLQPGNVNFELSHGCTGIADYLVDVGTWLGSTGHRRARMQAAFDAFTAHEELLAERLLSFLRGVPGVRILGERRVEPAGDGHGRRVATISFVAEGRRSDAIVASVDRANVGIRFGDFYARRLAERLGLRAHGGVVRISAVHYNTVEEIDRCIAALDAALQGR